MARTSRSTDTPARLSKAERAWLLKSATYASVLVACSLVFGKVWAWQATDSVSILSSLADSVLDVLASLLTFWAIRYSLEPPDREHRFGHVLREKPRDSYVLSTKVGRWLEPHDPKTLDRGQWQGGLNMKWTYDYTYDGTKRAIDQSFQRLGIERIDILLIHDIDIWGRM